MVFGLASGTLGCSDIRKDTFEVELTTDESPKIVELWNQRIPLSNDYARAFAIELPQNYYVYRDNHHYLKQTRIGLLLDKETLRPLVKRLSAEAGVIEPLDLSPGKEGALKREWGRYRQRDLLVTIQGSMPGYADLRQRLDASSTTLADFVGVRDGFKVFVPHGPIHPANAELPPLRGYSVADPLVHFYCGEGVANCGFSRSYRGVELRLRLPRKEMSKASLLMQKVVRLLDQHQARPPSS